MRRRRLLYVTTAIAMLLCSTNVMAESLAQDLNTYNKSSETKGEKALWTIGTVLGFAGGYCMYEYYKIEEYNKNRQSNVDECMSEGMSFEFCKRRYPYNDNAKKYARAGAAFTLSAIGVVLIIPEIFKKKKGKRMKSLQIKTTHHTLGARVLVKF